MLSLRERQSESKVPVPENSTIEPTRISPAMDKLLRSEMGYRLQVGKRRSRLEEFAQRLDLAQQSQTERIQQNVVDETLDIDAASTAIAADAANTSALQLAVNTLTDQLKGSEQELQQVRDAILREKLREELQELQIDARIVEERIVSLKKALHPVCLKMDALRSHGFDLINWKLNDSQTFFKMWLLDSVGEMPGCKTGLDVFLKRESWAETLPQPDQADSVRLTPYPEPKPIPTWSGVA